MTRLIKAEMIEERRIPRLIEICQEYKEAADVYERESRKDNNDRAMADAFSKMRAIAAIFWAGVEYGRHNPDFGEIRSWRAS